MNPTVSYRYAQSYDPTKVEEQAVVCRSIFDQVNWVHPSREQVFHRLMACLRAIADSSGVNKMSRGSLAVIFAFPLFSTPQERKKNSETRCRGLEFILENYYKIFPERIEPC